MLYICQNCGIEFESISKIAKFCSLKCSGESKTKKSNEHRKKICKICGKEFIAKDNTSKFCSIECRGKSRHKIAQEKNKKNCVGCGKVFTARDKTKKYCSKKCYYQYGLTRPKSKKHKKNIAKAQKHVKKEGIFECNRCGRIFNSNTALRAHKAHCQHKKEILICEKCGRKCKCLAGLKAHQIWCLNDNKNKSKRKKIINACKLTNIRRIKAGQNQSSDTDIEIIFKDLLKQYSINFEGQYLIENNVISHLYDFYIKEYNLIIELDGDYWHGNKGSLQDWQLNQISLDKKFTAETKKEGFKIIRFWGSSIKNNCKECIEEAIEYGKTGKHKIDGFSRDIRSWN